LAIEIYVGHVEIIDFLVREQNLIDMPMPLLKDIIILLARPRCLTLWVYDLNITNCLSLKVTK